MRQQQTPEAPVPLHRSLRRGRAQQQRVHHYAGSTDSQAMFIPLNGPQLPDILEQLFPAHRERLFPPTETLSMFLARSLSADGSRLQAGNDATVKRVIHGVEPGTINTGGYCKARARLPFTTLSSLALQAGEIIAHGAAPGWHWQGRGVHLADGATVTRPDTANFSATRQARIF